MTSTAMQLKPRRKAPSLVVLAIVASTIMAVSMGLRQCLGLFQASVTSELAISAAAFAFAVSLHNLVWGLSQPALGALGDRFGPRPVLIACGLLYATGLAFMATSRSSFLGLDLGLGVLTGIGVAGTSFGVLLGAVSRAAPPERRSQLLGLVSGIGSVGVLGLAPLGQTLIGARGWRVAALSYAAVGLGMVVLSVFVSGGRQQVEAASQQRSASVPQSGGVVAVAREAMSHGGFVCMTVAFFACGFQLQFITAHLPRFLGLCGLPPSTSATALGLIGLCNAIGSYAFGLLGAKYSRKRLLAGIYAIRTIAIAVYISLPISEASTLVFAAVMGFTWLGVVPLVSGLIGRLFGLRDFNLLFGLVFLCHQLGGFLGPLMGGLFLDWSGGYMISWYVMIVIGTIATVLQWPMDDLPRPRATGLSPA